MAKRRTSGEAVTDALGSAGMSINALADATGIPFSTLRRKVRDQADFTLGDLLLIAEALDTTPAALLPESFTESRVA